jgi:hypothetical protein
MKKVENIILEVAERNQNFEVYGNSNVLGIDFLNENKVVMECNYRC